MSSPLCRAIFPGYALSGEVCLPLLQPGLAGALRSFFVIGGLQLVECVRDVVGRHTDDRTEISYEQSLRQREKRGVRIFVEALHCVPVLVEQRCDGRGWGVTHPQPHRLGWMAVQKAYLMEVGVFGHYDEPVLRSLAPYGEIVSFDEAEVSHVDGVGVGIGQETDQLERQVLVEEKPQRSGTVISLRSRSAAKARQARMSSWVSSGKSERISSSLMPPARYSSTSWTVMRMPRMVSLPPRLPGSMVMMSR